MLARICAGLPPALTGLDDDATRRLVGHIDAVHGATTLMDEEAGAEWLATLRAVAGREDLHGLIEGRLTRILLDADDLGIGEVARRMTLATSRGQEPARVACWVEGFLAGGGLLLVHDARLLGLVDGWLCGLGADQFIQVLPLLRRTFGAFEAPERRAIGERVRATDEPGAAAAAPGGAGDAGVDEERAAEAVRTVLTILGRSGG
jgi:hypothetical protein